MHSCIEAMPILHYDMQALIRLGDREAWIKSKQRTVPQSIPVRCSLLEPVQGFSKQFEGNPKMVNVPIQKNVPMQHESGGS